MANEHFTSVQFHRFKAFKEYSIALHHFNVLVGPNNSGKSTILGAFRILAEGMRKARKRNANLVPGPNGETWGYLVDLEDISIATENVFFDYDESQPATVIFRISNGNELLLFFPERGACSLICRTKGRPVRSTTHFVSQYDAWIGFVPILGPVEHNEPLYQKDAARLALLTHRAARNFRNIWYHYPEEFDEFRALIKSTWPGMDINRPEVDYSHQKPVIHMFCPEERIPREIFWAGFGFQVWCQMVTYIVRGRDSSLFMIDEPDIYLHSDLQRQLLGILKSLGPDILIATHSTEIITDADPGDLLVINKKFRSAKRIKEPSQLQQVFQVLGSNLNPILTQLAKTKRALFVEGKDFHLISRFARKLGKGQVANRADFAVIPVEGFNPTKVKTLTQGMEITLSTKVITGVIFDRDYRSEAECKEVINDLKRNSVFVHIHSRKEVENFLLFPEPIGRAIESRAVEQTKRSGKSIEFKEDVSKILLALTEEMKHKVVAQYLGSRTKFERKRGPHLDDSTITEELMAEFDKLWSDIEKRMTLVPGKNALAMLNDYLQKKFDITISPSLIIDSFRANQVPDEMVELIEDLEKFRNAPTE